MENQSPPKKSLLRTVGESGAITTTGNMILRLIAAATSIIIIRYLSVYDYGLWQLILGVMGFAGLVTLPSLENLLIADLSVELGRNKEDIYKAIFRQSSFLIIALGFLAAAGLFFLAPLISKISGINLTAALRIMAGYFIIIALHRIYFLAFYSHLKFFHVQTFKVLNRFLYFLLILLFVLYLEKGFMGVIYAYVLSYGLGMLIFLPFFAKTVFYLRNFKTDIKYSLANTFKTHGKWALLNDYFDDLFNSSRPWLIGYFIGIEAVAVVSVAQSIFGELSNFLPFNQILSPIIPREIEYRERFKLLFERGIKYSFWFLIFAGVVAFFGVPYFIAILFPKYLPATPLFNVLLISLPTVPVTIITQQTFYALKSQKNLFFASAPTKTVLVFGVLPLLLKIFGAYGAVIQQILVSFSVSLIRLRVLSRAVPEIAFSFLNLLKFDETDKMLIMRILNALKNSFKKLRYV